MNADLWPTPRRLRTFLLAIWVGVAVLFVVGETTLGLARSAVKTLGHDTAPSIMAAQEISAALADLDANVANYLLGSVQQRATAEDQIETRRTAATEEIVHAAQNITYGEAERVPIVHMLDGFGRYLEMAAQARVTHGQGATAEAVQHYRDATQIMHATILPAADALDRANRAALDEAYQHQQTASEGSETVAAVLGLALLAALAATQWFLLRRMRRVFNPALVVATVLALAFMFYLVDSFGTAREDLRVAKQDAFDSIHLLYRARAAAYDANGEESRYLLDHDRAAQYEQAFRARTAELSTSPRITATELASLSQGQRPAFEGYLASELENITFPGERDAAVETTHWWSDYNAIDDRVRALETSGQHTAAIDLCLGYGENDSNWVFGHFDTALTSTIEINRRVFVRQIADSERRLATAAVVNPVLALAIALLAWLGLRPRLREYTG